MNKFGEKQESEQLRALLNSITKELDVNFLERRGRRKSHKANPIDELNDAILELNNREKDLQAAVGIALMLLDSTEKLESKIYKYKDKILQANDRSHHLTIEVKDFKEALITAEMKNEELKKTLVETEDALMSASNDLNHIMKARFSYNIQDLKESEIDEMKKEFLDAIDRSNEKRLELEKLNKKYLDQFKILEKDLESTKDQLKITIASFNKSQEKLKDSEIKAKKLESDLLECEKVRETLDQNLKISSSSYQRLKLYCERLEEELSITESKKPIEKYHYHNHSSLHSELSLLEPAEASPPSSFCLDESLEDLFFARDIKKTTTLFTPSTRFTSIQSYSKLFTVSTSNHIKIYPRKAARKDAPEEYFFLTTQIIKMNSPQMENICAVNTQIMYEKAIRDGVAFHKWHEWIEKELYSAYLQTLYKKKTKFYWMKSTQKKQLILPS